MEVVNNSSCNKKQLITADYNDTIFFNRYKRLWFVNNKSYDSNLYIIRLVKDKSNGHTNQLKKELMCLKNFTNLKKKIQTLNNQIKQYETATLHNDKDSIYLKGNQIKKSRCLISKYLSKLQGDNFKINRVGETCFNMSFSGDYVKLTHRGNILADGVF